MDYKAIYEQAVQAGQQAEADFIAQYGEPMYCGFAWVDISDGRDPFVNLQEIKHGLQSNL